MVRPSLLAPLRRVDEEATRRDVERKVDFCPAIPKAEALLIECDALRRMTKALD